MSRTLLSITFCAVALALAASAGARSTDLSISVVFHPNHSVTATLNDGRPLGTTSGAPTVIPPGHYNVNLDDFHQEGLKGCRWQGQLMALPLDLWPHVIFYNRNLFKDAGVADLPTDWNDKEWTTDKYLELSQKLTKRQGDKVTQFGSGKNKGLATLALVEGAVKGGPSFASCTTKGTKQASVAALSKKTLQLLHGSDNHAKFRTKGRYSAATIRGTVWTIADRCDGTIVHVTRGIVDVTDFVRHITVVVRAGHTYLALAKPKKHK